MHWADALEKEEVVQALRAGKTAAIQALEVRGAVCAGCLVQAPASCELFLCNTS